MDEFPAGVPEQLGYYVYLYIDPRDEKPFYVGKGKDNRAFTHLFDTSETRKVQRIKDIEAAGRRPRIKILRHNLPDAASAYLVESVAIDLIGLENLTNEVAGHGSDEFGLTTVEELAVRYGAPAVTIDDSVLLIRITQNFPLATTDLRLYEYTRGIWRTWPHQMETQYACAVYQGVVREVYEIERWVKAGSTPYLIRKDMKVKNRWEFIGQVAEPAIRDKYRLKSVKKYLKRGNADPLVLPKET